MRAFAALKRHDPARAGPPTKLIVDGAQGFFRLVEHVALLYSPDALAVPFGENFIINA